MRKKRTHTPEKRKAMTLTSHTAAMNLMIQLTSNRVVPRQCLGPIPQFLVGAATEKGAQAVTSQRRMPHQLQGIKQHSDRHRVQYHRLQRAHHLDQRNGSNWNELTQGAQRALETPPANQMSGEPSRGVSRNERRL